MLSFKFRRNYDLIVINWCLGYLSDPEAVLFLTECSRHIRKDQYILFLDNVLSDKEEREAEKGQRFRAKSDYERLFSQAKLKILKTEKKCLKRGYQPIHLWVL